MNKTSKFSNGGTQFQMNAAVSSSLAGMAVPSISPSQSPMPASVSQSADQFKRTPLPETFTHKNSSPKSNGKVWTGFLPLRGIAVIFTDWRTAFNKIKAANPIKPFREIGIALKEMGRAILQFLGKALGHVLEAGFYAPDLFGYLLEAGFHMLKFLVDIPFAVFG